jgi:hypothetical protein
MMARTYAGQDSEDLRDAFAALQQVRNFAELNEFIADTPIVRTAAFAAMFRQMYLQSGSDKRQQGDNIGLYQGFFRVLHFFKHRERCASVGSEWVLPSPPPKPGPIPPIPPLYDRLLQLLNGRAAPHDNAPADPQRDIVRIGEAIAKATGRSADLPRYEPTPGVKWTLLSLRCARCGLEYSAVRAHAIDLVAATDLFEPVREGRINGSACPRCGEACAWPLGAFVEDPPFPSDPLASFSCAIKVANDFFAYQPPPGTVRHPDLDRVLEVRFGFRVEELGWEFPKVTSMRVLYAHEDLGSLAQRTPAAIKIPRAMEVLITEIAHKIGSGALAPYEAEQANCQNSAAHRRRLADPCRTHLRRTRRQQC